MALNCNWTLVSSLCFDSSWSIFENRINILPKSTVQKLHWARRRCAFWVSILQPLASGCKWLTSNWLQVATSVRSGENQDFCNAVLRRNSGFLQSCARINHERIQDLSELATKKSCSFYIKKSKCTCWILLAWVTSGCQVAAWASGCKWLQNQKSKCTSFARSLISLFKNSI